MSSKPPIAISVAESICVDGTAPLEVRYPFLLMHHTDKRIVGADHHGGADAMSSLTASTLNHKEFAMSNTQLVTPSPESMRQPAIETKRPGRRGLSEDTRYRLRYGNYYLSLEDILDNVGFIQQPDRNQKQWYACCPAHCDTEPSLSISVGDNDETLLYCHTGCEFDDIIAAIRKSRDERRDKARSQSNTLPAPMSSPYRQPTSLNDTVPFKTDDDRPAIDWHASYSTFRDALTSKQRKKLANQLGIDEASLDALEMGWNDEKKCFTFPERDAQGRVIGVGTRSVDGVKRCLQGSKRGLYLPANWKQSKGELYICEGPSDTAAILTIGLGVVGRPSARGGTELLIELLGSFVDREIVILGENDRKEDGSWPGRDAAKKLAKKLAVALKRPIDFGMPPTGIKDAREWLKKTLTKGRTNKQEKKNG